MGTETPSYIAPHMKELAVRERIRKLVETDWRTEGQKLLNERLEEKRQGKDPYVSCQTIMCLDRVLIHPLPSSSSCDR